jgi:DNA mismatch endonuclease, patch repair protein
MPDAFEPAVRRRIMQAIPGRDTRPEIAVRRFLHRHGFRFLLHSGKLPGRPDLTLPKYRTVVFVHGCFWHQHSCRLGKTPKSNKSYWLPKFARNQDRDRACISALRKLHWRVIVIWECETQSSTALRRKLLRRLQSMPEFQSTNNDRSH